MRVESEGTGDCETFSLAGDREPLEVRLVLEPREATLPPWADEAWFDHYFRPVVNTRVPESAWGTALTVGDEATILGDRPFESA